MRCSRRFLAMAALLVCVRPGQADTGQLVQVNRVSDIGGVANYTDARLLNPWGVVATSDGPFIVADAGRGVLSVYAGSGRPVPCAVAPLTVNIPPAANSRKSAPTGIVENGSAGFAFSSGGKMHPAEIIAASADGAISAWAKSLPSSGSATGCLGPAAVDVSVTSTSSGVQTTAVTVIDNSAAGGVSGLARPAIYRALEIAPATGGGTLYAVNISSGVVEMYDSSFHFVRYFTDPGITPDAASPGWAPFGIARIGGFLYVTFVLQNASRSVPVNGPGNGFVDVFDLKGKFIRKLIPAGGALNSPWGLAQSSGEFGGHARALLVGNFGDGTIQAFQSQTGQSLGPLRHGPGNPAILPGLWTIKFTDAEPDRLYFTAGLNGLKDGVFGVLGSEP